MKHCVETSSAISRLETGFINVVVRFYKCLITIIIHFININDSFAILKMADGQNDRTDTLHAPRNVGLSIY